MHEWERVEGKDPLLSSYAWNSRLKVPGGWIYRIFKGRYEYDSIFVPEVDKPVRYKAQPDTLTAFEIK